MQKEGEEERRERIRGSKTSTLASHLLLPLLLFVLSSSRMRHGLLLIDKPEGATSHDIVASVRKILHEPKIGHGGTLDPLATGVLPLFVGAKALKVVELFKNLFKVYEARITFGKVSATYDREGPIEIVQARPGWEPPSIREFEKTLEQKFTGNISQVPPAHSAVHVEGKRAYEIIRAGLDLTLPSRSVTIERLQLISYRYPEACLRITCSSGTYIRSLAHDLGQVLRCGAYLERLKRLQVGTWKLDDANILENVAWGQVIPLKELLAPFPRLDLTEGDFEEVQFGRSIYQQIGEEGAIGWFHDLPVAIFERDKKDAEKAHPRKIL
ncbi:MAG: tRNA pseudouridine(55) synthase TruB [Patescibacteria group bacterium]